MADDLNPVPEIPQEEEPGYSRSRYTFLLVIMTLLLAFIVFARFAVPSKKTPPSTDQQVLGGDMGMKLYYFHKYFASTLGPASHTKNSRLGAKGTTRRAASIPQPTDDRLNALSQYAEAVRLDPSPFNIRRLIIAANPNQRPWAIHQFTRVRRSEVPTEERNYSPEIRMWTAIYLSDEPLKPSQVREYESKIRSLGLGWLAHLARADLYERAGIKEKASAELAAAEQEAVRNIILIALMGLGLLLVIMLGIILDVYYITTKQQGLPSAPNNLMALSPARRSLVSGYLLEAFVIYQIAFVGLSLFGVIVTRRLIRAGLLYPDTTTMTVVDLVETLIWGLVALAFLLQRLRSVGWTLADLGLKSHDLWRDIKWGVAGYIGSVPIFLAAALLALRLTKFFKTPPNPVQTLLVGNESWLIRLLLLLMMSVMAPFFEELFFRGTLFGSLRVRWRLPVSIVISAAIFALVHPLPLGFLPIFVLGSVLAVLYNQRGSLIPNMITHGLHNGMIFLFIVLVTS